MFDEPEVVALSDEQKQVVDSLVARNNTVVFAKAGCGKTTTALESARAFFEHHGKRTLLLTYNSMLKDETRRRVMEQLLATKVEAHSFHAAAYRFFGDDNSGDDETHEAVNFVAGNNGGADDRAIFRALGRQAVQPLKFGLLILDEAQDTTPTYAKFVQHLLKFFVEPPVMMILGDPFQRIFRYAGATMEYLRNPAATFGPQLQRPTFVIKHLNISYRITHEMAEFINENLNPLNLHYAIADIDEWRKEEAFLAEAWGTGIRANPARGPCPDSVRYEFVNPYDSHLTYVPLVADLISTYGGGQVALLARSLASSTKTSSNVSPIIKILEALSKHENENWITLYGSKTTLGDSKIAARVMKDKRVCSTIHRMKGLERDAIIVVGLDNYYEKNCRTLEEHLDLFNLFYVACTRARERLVVWKVNVADYVTVRKRRSPRTLKHKALPCEISHLVKYSPFDQVLDIPGQLLVPQIRIQSEDTKEDFCNIFAGSDDEDDDNEEDENGVGTLDLDRPLVRVEVKERDILMTGRSPGTTEDLSKVLGTAIETMIFFRCLNALPTVTYEMLLDRFHDVVPADELWNFMQQLYDKKKAEITWSDIVRVAIVKICCTDGFIHTWRQLNHAELDKWLKKSTAFLERSVRNARTLLLRLLNLDQNDPPSSVPIAKKTRMGMNQNQWAEGWRVLRPHLKFWQHISTTTEYDWFHDKYSELNGEMHILLSNGIVVHLSIAPHLQMMDVQLAQACMCLDPQQRGKEAVVLIANLGEVYSIGYAGKGNRGPEFIYRLLRRRMLLPVDENHMQDQPTADTSSSPSTTNVKRIKLN